MIQRHPLRLCILLSSSFLALCSLAVVVHGDESSIDGKMATFAGRQWLTRAPRAELRPEFTVAPAEAESTEAALGLRTSASGLAGWWQTDVAVQGGQTYQVSLLRLVSNVAAPHRSAVARIDWLDDKDRRVPSDRPFVRGVLEGWHDSQQPDYLNEELPRTSNESIAGENASASWKKLHGTYTAPRGAVKARLELHLRWADVGAAAYYRSLTWKAVDAPARRPVKLATIHLKPRGGNPQANREAFKTLVTDAAGQGAQLIVLPETLTYYGTGQTPLESSEPVPGPTSEYFGQLAKELKCHIVATCFEKDEYQLFNTAVLLGPDGTLVGKYRKVCLPRSEIEAGVTPGTEYPVFETSLGRIGMMICYDGFFPQVAQRLTDAGAEVIAWPVWGCNPLLAQARAAENQVAIVSSTYESPDRNWMISAVYDPNGQVVAQAAEWGSFAMAELDLSQPPYWPSLGTHRTERFHHQPAAE